MSSEVNIEKMLDQILQDEVLLRKFAAVVEKATGSTQWLRSVSIVNPGNNFARGRTTHF